VVVIELKYIKKDKKMAGSLSKDAERLNSITIETIDNQIKLGHGGHIKKGVAKYKLHKAIIVAWKENSISKQITKEHPVLQYYFYALARKVIPDGIEETSQNISKAMFGKIASRAVGTKFGSLRAGSTISWRKFWVASFIHTERWSQIKFSAEKIDIV
jgi:hypothetical protein